MLRKFGSHLRNQWIGTLALFLVLGGGTAYAVTQIDRNSVKSKQIVNGQVKEADLADAARGLSKVTTRSAYFTSGNGTASCNPGEVVTGGGVGTDVPSTMYVARSEPSPNNGEPTGWTALVNYRADGSGASGTVFVLCASP
jgi:hypothetical protein